MNLSELVTNLIVSLSAGLAFLGVALLSQYVAAKLQGEHKRRSEELESVLTEEEAKSKVLEVPMSQATDRTANLSATYNYSNAAATGVEIEKLVKGYHEQALSQASIQFWFSIMAAVTGFAWILYSGSEVNEKLITATKILPGAVVDAVAYLFFKQASQTRERATELYDRLRRDKKISDSAALVIAIDNSRLRSAVRAQIALHMAGLNSKPIDFEKFIEADDDKVS